MKQPDHDYHETTRDRDDRLIDPTCAYCGKPKHLCDGGAKQTDEIIRLKQEVEGLKARLRKTAQILIQAVGADGPMDAEVAAEKIVMKYLEAQEALRWNARNRAEKNSSITVKLTSKRFDRTVVVSLEDPLNLESSFSEIQNEIRFPVGTEAILGEIRSYPDLEERVAWVIVDGRLGWVWECEVEYIRGLGEI